MLSAPNPEKVVADGVGTIIIRPAKDVDIFKEFMFTNIAVRRDWAEKNRSLVEAYCKAVDRANKFIMENRTKAAEILNKTWYKETPVQILDLTLDGFGSNTDGDMSEQGVKNQLGVYGELGVIEGKFDTSEGVLWTNKYNPHSFPKK
jgi:ABC-type nitrate/sulfonate/bicarbonate transport system substrate-binding protein